MQLRLIVSTTTILFLATPASARTVDWHDAESVARAATAQHPSLTSLQTRIVAARERVQVAGAYPNPMAMGGVQNQPVDLSNDQMMTMYMIGASQTIPRRSRREVLRRSAELEVETLQLEVMILREEIRRNALFAWYDLAAADSKLRVTEELATATDAVTGAARIRYEAGAAMQADVIRAQLQRTDLDHQLLTLRGARRIAASRLLAQLGLPITTEVPPLRLPHQTAARMIHGVPEVPDAHPALAILLADGEQREQEIRLARLIGKPDWNLEASYGVRTGEKDMFSVVARVELPVRRKSLIEPQVRTAIAERDAASLRLEEERRRLLEEMSVAWGEHATTTDQLRLHEEVLVPQSKLAFEATLAAYEAGRDVFESVVTTRQAWLRLQIDYYDFLARHIKAITDFEAIRRGARSGALGAMSTASSGRMNQPAAMQRSSSMTGSMR